ncbi:MAG: hypothetical protein ACNA71_04425 [Kiritimatiellia bacterium]
MIKVFAKNIDTEAAAQKIVDAAQNRQKHVTLPLERLISSRVQSPAGFKNNTAFIKALLVTLQDSAFVDISDFEIIERRQRWSRPLIALKKGIWGLLRFYTFRLWSQQNEVNGFLLAALQGIHEDANERITKLEARITELEKQLDD